MDEGTPLLALQEGSKSAGKRARAGAYLIIFVAGLCVFHLGLDCGLPSIGASVVPPPPCCLSGSTQEGRRATEAIQDGLHASTCVPCPRLSSGAGSSSTMAPASSITSLGRSPLYAVHPCPVGPHITLTASKGQLGRGPPKWPIPTITGLIYTSSFVACSKSDIKARVGEHDCWWRSSKAGSNPVRHPASYHCDRAKRARDKRVGAHSKRHGEGETLAEADHRRAIANGHASEADYKKARERAFTEKHGAPRESRGMKRARLRAMLQLEHVRSIAWSGEYTGADGRVDTLHSSARDEIMAQFFGLYKPANAVGGIKHLAEHQAHCGDYIIADTEFFSPRATNIDAENLSDLDDSSDDSPDQKYDGSWGRTHDAAIILVDCNGNLKYKLFSEKMVGARTPL